MNETNEENKKLPISVLADKVMQSQIEELMAMTGHASKTTVIKIAIEHYWQFKKSQLQDMNNINIQLADQ